MHLDLNDDDAATLRSVLQERVTQLDKQIGAADSLRFKDALRDEERSLERILGALSRDPTTSTPADWPRRDGVTDTDGR